MLGVSWDGPLGPRRTGEAVAPFGSADAGLTEAQALAVLVSVAGVGPATIERLVSRLGSASEVVRVALHPDAWRLIRAAGSDEGRGQGMSDEIATALIGAARDADAFVAVLERLGVRPIAVADPGYPARLRSIEVPPPVLFVRGDPAALAAVHPVAVVGTRRPTDAGRRTAARIAGALARAGAVVVSGLATGVDGSAHAATVGEGGTTVAVIGSGHSRLFPAVHERLAEAIVESGGAVVSEHAPETTPTRGTFPRRNRIISGLVDAVVVVEAGARSGALLTASWALEQGREVFLVPGPIDAPASAGCNGFLREWPGITRIVSGVPQLLDDLGLAAEAALAAEALPAGTARRAPRGRVRGASSLAVLTLLDALDRHAASAILGGAATVDELAAITAAPVGAILAALTRLEVGGLVVGDRGRYRPTESLVGTSSPRAGGPSPGGNDASGG